MGLANLWMVLLKWKGGRLFLIKRSGIDRVISNLDPFHSQESEWRNGELLHKSKWVIIRSPIRNYSYSQRAVLYVVPWITWRITERLGYQEVALK